jgi:endonuclease YncB( thermonuclease family)
MSSEIFFGLLIFIGAILLAYLSRDRSAEKHTQPHSPSEAKPPNIKPVQRAQHGLDASTSKPAETKRTVSGTARIVDGDTIVIQKTQIRLFGIDAPELNHPYGKNAKWALVALCKGQKVRAEIVEVDHFGRTVAKCFLPDGRDLSCEMVKKGPAIDWPKFSGGIYSDLEVPNARRKMWLADARQKGRKHVWESFEARSS